MAREDNRHLAGTGVRPAREDGDLKSAGAGGPVPQRGKSPADRSFDFWLAKQLHAMYEIEPRPT